MNEEPIEDGPLVASLVGRTIVAAQWIDEGDGSEWCEHEAAILTLDDGRVVAFRGWGYEAWGARVELGIEKPAGSEPAG